MATIDKITYTHDNTEYELSTFNPGNTGTTGQVLTKTNNGYEYADVPVTSVNSKTGAVTVSEFTAASGGVKVFTFPSANDDITSLVTWLNSGGDAILKDSNSYCRVTMNDSVNREIRAIKEAGSSRDERVIEYDSSKIVTSILATERKYFAPDNAGSIGDVLTKKVGGYEWAAPSGGIENITTGTTTTVTGVWAGTEAEYGLITPDTSTLYFVF